MRWSLTPCDARSGFCSCILSRTRSGFWARTTTEVTKTTVARAVKIHVRTQAQTRAAGRPCSTVAAGTPYLEVGGGAQGAGAVGVHGAGGGRSWPEGGAVGPGG